MTLDERVELHRVGLTRLHIFYPVADTVSRLLILCLLHSGLSSKQVSDTVWCPLSLSLSRSLSRALSLSLSLSQVQVQVQEGPGRE